MPARTGRPALYGLLHSLMDAPRGQVPGPTPRPGRGHRRAGGLPQAAGHAGGGVRLPRRRRRAWTPSRSALGAADPAAGRPAPGAGGGGDRPARAGAAGRGPGRVRRPRERDSTRSAPFTQDAPTRTPRPPPLQREGTRVALRRAGVAHLVLRTDRDWVFDIAQFVLRQRRTAPPGTPGQVGTAVTFLSPLWLWLFALVALLVAGYVAAQFARRRYTVRFTNLRAARPRSPRPAPAGGGTCRRSCSCVMMSLLVVGAARPADEVRVPRDRATIMIAAGRVAVDGRRPTSTPTGSAPPRPPPRRSSRSCRTGSTSASSPSPAPPTWSSPPPPTTRPWRPRSAT